VNSLGQIVKENRAKAGLTQRALSDKLGFSTVQIISRIENGHCGISEDKLSKLSKIIKVSAKSLKKALEKFNVERNNARIQRA